MNRKLTLVTGAAVAGAACGVLLKAGGAPPNIESLMPFAVSAGIALGPLGGFLQAASMRAVYDGYQAWAGVWTIGTAVCYGAVGLLAAKFGRRFATNRVKIALFGGAMAVAYDALSLIVFYPMFPMPVDALIIGQIPFTINHVLSSVVSCFLVGPFLLNVFDQYLSEGRLSLEAIFKKPVASLVKVEEK